MTRALVIGQAERLTIAALRVEAAKPENIRDAATLLTEDPKAARDRNSEQTIDLPHGFRITYTIERQPFGLCRHISISVDAAGRGPHPAAVDMILEAFGMKSWEDSIRVWPENTSPTEWALNIVQPLPAEGGTA